MGIRYDRISDSNYLEVLGRMNLEKLSSYEEIPLDILEELKILTLQCQEVDCDTVLVRRNSELGKFIMEHHDLFYDLFKDYISYHDVVDAFNISVYEDDIKMSNKLMRPFSDRACGTVDMLVERYDEKVVNYIVEHRDFDSYLAQLDGKDTDLVYENFNISERQRSVSDNSARVYVKK